MVDLLVIGFIVAYIQIGFVIGRLSWRVWFEDEETGVVSFLLFPYSHLIGEIGESALIEVIARPHGPDGGARRRYLAVIAIAWPLKVVWNAFTIALIGIAVALTKAVEVSLVFHVRRRLRLVPPPIARPPEPRAQKHPLVTPSAHEKMLEEELVELMVQRKRLDRRIRELEFRLAKKYGSGKFRLAKRSGDN